MGSVCIVIPAYNEAMTIERVVGQARQYGHVVVVCDSSSDGTGDLAESAGATVVRHSRNRGYDGALQSGFDAALRLGAKATVTLDADGQLDAAQVPEFTAPILSGEADLVLGRRPSAARVSERLMNRYAKFRFGIDDLLCGLKAYDAALLERFRLDGSPSIGTQIAFAALKGTARHRVLPVVVSSREDESRIGGRWRANCRITRALCGLIAWDIRH